MRLPEAALVKVDASCRRAGRSHAIHPARGEARSSADWQNRADSFSAPCCGPPSGSSMIAHLASSFFRMSGSLEFEVTRVRSISPSRKAIFEVLGNSTRKVVQSFQQHRDRRSLVFLSSILLAQQPVGGFQTLSIARFPFPSALPDAC